MSQVVMHRIRITYETEVMDRTVSEPPPAGETIEYTIESLLKPVVHDGCWCFVLDPQHDPHARIALAAYAVDCAPHYPKLAEDLRKVLGKVTHG